MGFLFSFPQDYLTELFPFCRVITVIIQLTDAIQVPEPCFSDNSHCEYDAYAFNITIIRQKRNKELYMLFILIDKLKLHNMLG